MGALGTIHFESHVYITAVYIGDDISHLSYMYNNMIHGMMPLIMNNIAAVYFNILIWMNSL